MKYMLIILLANSIGQPTKVLTAATMTNKEQCITVRKIIENKHIRTMCIQDKEEFHGK
jgi:hypothetical protein